MQINRSLRVVLINNSLDFFSNKPFKSSKVLFCTYWAIGLCRVKNQTGIWSIVSAGTSGQVISGCLSLWGKRRLRFPIQGFFCHFLNICYFFYSQPIICKECFTIARMLADNCKLAKSEGLKNLCNSKLEWTNQVPIHFCLWQKASNYCNREELFFCPRQRVVFFCVREFEMLARCLLHGFPRVEWPFLSSLRSSGGKKFPSSDGGKVARESVVKKPRHTRTIFCSDGLVISS